MPVLIYVFVVNEWQTPNKQIILRDSSRSMHIFILLCIACIALLLICSVLRLDHSNKTFTKPLKNIMISNPEVHSSKTSEADEVNVYFRVDLKLSISQ